MKLLAIDTALGACSAAVFDAATSRILAHAFAAMEKGHAEAIAPMVQDVMVQAGLQPPDLNGIAVTVGPGTFTGVRIGLSMARGMGLALGIPVTGVDTLTATAIPHLNAMQPLVVAHRAGGTGKYYAGFFATGEKPQLTQPLALMSAGDVADELVRINARLVGTGLDDILALRPSQKTTYHFNLPDAAGFAAHAASLGAGPAMPDPVYLREPDARPNAPTGLATPRVRSATMEDLPHLARLHGLSFEKGWTADALASALALPGALALIVEVGGTRCGFVQVQQVAGEAEINTLCVAPDYRRQHLAAALVDALHAMLAAGGITKVHLEVAEGNEAARALYASRGYSETGRRKSYYERPDGRREDAITMACSLVAEAS